MSDPQNELLAVKDECERLRKRCLVLATEKLDLEEDKIAMELQLSLMEKQRDFWKASHDNQVKLKAAIVKRPDLKDRAPLVEALAAERDALREEIAALKK